VNTMTRRRLLIAGAATAVAPARLFGSSLLHGRAFSDSQLDSIGAATSEAVGGGDVPGAISIVWQDGEIRCTHWAGARDVETQLPMESSTLMGIASMSKPVTVAVAMMLVEQGRMKLDDPITRWAPEFANMRVLRRSDGPLDDSYPAARVITVEDLMTHRSGLSYGFLAQGPLAGALFTKFGMGIESAMSPDAWMRAMAELPLAYAPGERFNYGHSIDVLGFVIARAAGGNLRQLMREQLFDPLGMKDTDFWVPPEKRARAARVYFSPAAGQFMRVTMTGFNGVAPPVYTSGGQGLISTANDYLKFSRLLLQNGAVDGKRLLQPDSVKRMSEDHLTATQRQFPAFMDQKYWDRWGCGLGMTVVRNPALAGSSAAAGAFGWGGAFGGWWQADPRHKSILLWLQSCLPAPPSPGSPLAPRVPGATGVFKFQRSAYAAMDAVHGG
jgi:CubicO group peptidase (beta-lactamase class C family)